MANPQATPPHDEARLATGYSRPTPGEPYVPAARADHGVVNPAGGMASTIEDLGRYLAFHMGSSSTILSAKNLRDMAGPSRFFDDEQRHWTVGKRDLGVVGSL